MKIIINGNTFTCPEGADLTEALELLHYKHGGIAVALNQTIIHKDDWAKTKLNEQDEVDVFQVVAGG